MGSVYLRGSSWVVKYKDDNGNWKRMTVGQKPTFTKTSARAVLNDIERKVKLGQYDMIKAKIPSLKEFSDKYVTYQKDVKQKRSWERDKRCLVHLTSFFGNHKLSDIKPKDIDDFKEFRLKKVKPGTVNRELQVLRHLFNLAQRWDHFFGKNPVSEAGLFHLNNQMERILSPEEEEVLLNSAPYYLRNIILCALNTGIRKGEIITLKWENIDLEKNLITIDQENSKSKKSRRLPINSILRKLLLELKLKSASNDHVFLNSQGKPYTRQDSLNRAFKLALEKAQIRNLRFHDLRHTAGTRLGEAGVTVQVIREILGHSDIRTTMRYVHPGDSLRDAVEKLAISKRNGHISGHIDG